MKLSNCIRSWVLALGVASASIASTVVSAAEVGLRLQELSAPASMPVALFYPTEEPAKPTQLGPFLLQVSLNAQPQAQMRGLVLLSHGTGGSEFNHVTLASALAAQGYLVAAVRHPGDNWRDRTLLFGPTEQNYFEERPRQLSRALDVLLKDPQWSSRVAKDAHGVRVAALGHSAGGYTAIALVGGVPDTTRIQTHCATQADQDPVFCGLGRRVTSHSNVTSSVRDTRIRGAIALAPVAVLFAPESIARLNTPLHLHVGAQDTFLVPRFHGQSLDRLSATVSLAVVPNANHWAFLDKPPMPIVTEDGDIGRDLPGFDRAAYLRALSTRVLQQIEGFWSGH